MYTKRLKSMLLSSFFASTISVAAPNPASIEWVKAYVQVQLAQLEQQTTLTDVNWAALCPDGIANGCNPDCQGTQAATCQTVLNATSVQNYLGIAQSVSDGMYVKQFIPNSSSNALGPSIDNASSNPALCGLFSTAGACITPRSNITTPGSVSLFAAVGSLVFSAGTTQEFSPNALYSTGAMPSNTIFYLVCLGYDANGVGANNAAISGLTATW